MIRCGCRVQGTFGMRTGNAVLHSIRNLSLFALCWTTPERVEKPSASSMSSTLALSQARTRRNKSFWSHDRGTASTCWPQHRVPAPRGRLRGGGQPFGEGPAKKWGDDEPDGNLGRVYGQLEQTDGNRVRLSGWTVFELGRRVESSRRYAPCPSDPEGAENKQVRLLFSVCGWK